jgi:hypothetical protein
MNGQSHSPSGVTVRTITQVERRVDREVQEIPE